MWNAIDFSEGRSQETFAVRFKNAEIANNFREKFIQGQKENIALGGSQWFFLERIDHRRDLNV